MEKLQRSLVQLIPVKSYYAMEKLFSHSNGRISFPRPRENFEIAKKKVNKNEVALITGEEKNNS